MNFNEVYIVSATRTPIGSFNGSLSSLTASQLGGLAISAALEKISLAATEVQELLMGHVLSANVGQAPATQAAKFAGLADIPATTINKVCASGMKAVILGAQSIALGQNDVVISGGMESMSNVPYYLDKARSGYRLGHGQLTDGLIKDGLWDVYNDFHMGAAAELCAKTFSISREQQDLFAIKSYERAQQAQINLLFKDEIIPVNITDNKGITRTIDTDEGPQMIKFDKVSNLKPVFQSGGTVTAANSSTLNDGAAALILMSKSKAQSLQIKPLAKIIAYADAQQAPEWYTTSPAKAIPLALKKAGLQINQIDAFEINEAFAVVTLANNQLLGLNDQKVNINGGAVALGHPLGASGARIIISLLSVLNQQKSRFGVASICNGGGGASAIVIENLR